MKSILCKPVFMLRNMTIIALLVLSGSLACAHSVFISAYPDGDEVCGEVMFSSGKGVVGAEVQISDINGGHARTVKTDKNGEFSFIPEFGEDHIVKVRTGDGHAAEVVVKKADLPLAAISGSKKEKTGSPEASIASQEGICENAATDNSAPSETDAVSKINSEELKRIVDEAVSKRMKTVLRRIDEMGRKRRFSDIIGGIGYIFGIFGLYLFLRRKLGDRK